jgi:hypothetical protein
MRSIMHARHRARRGQVMTRAAVLAVTIATASAVASGIATADNAVADGDGVTPVTNNTLAIGTVCINSSTPATALVAVQRTGPATPGPAGANTFKNSQTLTAAVNGTSGTGLSASMTTTSIALGSGWTGSPANTISPTASSSVTFVAGSTAGAFAGTVTYDVTGLNVNNVSITKSKVMNVTATVSDTGSCAPAPTDTTPPVVSLDIPNPIAGSNGWFNSGDTVPVVINVTAADDSNITDISCTGGTFTYGSGYGTTSASGTLSVSGDGTHAVSCTATDGATPANTGAGPGSTNTGTVYIDTTAPVITDVGFNSGTPGNNSWYVTAVVEDFSASDATSGLADCLASFTQSSGTTEGSAVTIPSGSCSDAAGNTNAGVDSAAYMIDLTDPSVVCDAAPQFILNQSGATVSATVTDTPSGPLSSPVTAAADTSSVGSFSASVTGEDNAGRTTTVSCSYSVIYNWTGFFQPVDNTGWNSAKAGQSIPVKFNLGGNQGTSILLAGNPKITQVTCPNSVVPDPIETYVTTTAGQSSLTYDSVAQQYVYVWKTDKLKWPGKCFTFELGLNDNTSHTFSVQFTK